MSIPPGADRFQAEEASPRVTLEDLRHRAWDLARRMTLEEKAGQMGAESPAIERLGIPPYHWWNECLHGVGRHGRATVFPQAIGLAATFDPHLVERVFTVVSHEALIKHQAAIRQGYRGIYGGLTFWTPNINIFRDPRWGRGQETYGEDPHLTATMGCAVVRGLQGDDPVWYRTAACAKHFAVHSGPEAERHGFDARVGPQDLASTYLPAFRALVQAGVESVMAAYNRVNGEPACASPTLLGLLRGPWSFPGHVVSDCGALDDIHRRHGAAADAVEAAALAVRNGCDLCCGDTYRHLPEAVRRGLVEEEVLTASVARLLLCRLRLGLAGGPWLPPRPPLEPGALDGPRHRALARDAARASIVLVRNRGILPLAKDAGSYFVTGPFADDTAVMMGNYHGNSRQVTTILQGIVGAVAEGTNIQTGAGVGPASTSIQGFACTWILPLTKPAAIIAVVGNSPAMEGEEGDAAASEACGDRRSLGLPGVQETWLRELRRQRIPLIVILTGGSPIACPWLDEHADAVLQVFYPGCAGGEAVADVLFGDHNPSGRLPFTVPRCTEDLPAFTDYGMAGRTYRFATRDPLWWFGEGLSYSTFTYLGADLACDRIRRGMAVSLIVSVRNDSTRDGHEVVQVYLQAISPGPGMPRWSLVAYSRLAIPAGATGQAHLTISPESLLTVASDGQEIWQPGPVHLRIGGQGPANPELIRSLMLTT